MRNFSNNFAWHKTPSIQFSAFENKGHKYATEMILNKWEQLADLIKPNKYK